MKKTIVNHLVNGFSKVASDFFIFVLSILHLVLFLGVGRLDVKFYSLIIIVVLSIFLLYWHRKLQTLSKLLNKKLVVCYYLLFLSSWILLIFVNYSAIKYNNFDTGIFANNVAHYVFYGGYYSTILQIPALADHFTPGLILFAPLLKLYPTFLWFPLAKVLLYFVCPIILFYFSGAVLGTQNKLCYFPPLLWIVHGYLARTLLMQFQPSSLALPFILGAFFLSYQRRWFLMFVMLCVVLTLKEQMALVWISLGFFQIFMQSKRFVGASLLVSGIAIGLFIVFVLTPELTGQANIHLNQFGPLSYVKEKLIVLFMAFLSVGFVPLLSLRSLTFILPAFGLALISTNPQMITLDFHYQDVPLTILFVGVIFGLKELESGWFKSRLQSNSRELITAISSICLICSILEPDSVLHQTTNRFVLFADNVNFYPLSQGQSDHLRQELQNRCQTLEKRQYVTLFECQP
jgi:uncharacterized membrane protein